ncbi:MAG: amino acid--tRNA ligase-related protein, partial [Myxococcota bacterium]
MAESTLSRIRGQRIEKLERLRALGIEPYPSRANRSHGCGDIEDAFETLEGERVAICGRVMFLRRQGALTFSQIQDESGRVQAALGRDTIPEQSSDGALGYTDLKLLDIGDYVQIEGPVAKTKRGEVSVFGDTIRLLAKGIRPLPEKHKGLADREAILRRRYLHVTTQPEIKDHFGRVACISRSARDFLWARGFIEFATPVIQTQYGGGTANPFRTHVDALGIDAYLSISHELYLKRLIAAGYEKVFTI